MPLTVTDDLMRAMATKEKAIADGRKLSKDGSFRGLQRTEDGTLIWGTCKGSALYSVSVDLGGDKPVPRCTCPVKPPRAPGSTTPAPRAERPTLRRLSPAP